MLNCNNFSNAIYGNMWLLSKLHDELVMVLCNMPKNGIAKLECHTRYSKIVSYKFTIDNSIVLPGRMTKNDETTYKKRSLISALSDELISMLSNPPENGYMACQFQEDKIIWSGVTANNTVIAA